jgi:sigma-B regulation protein RsbU (phosphoserine phosphatase)
VKGQVSGPLLVRAMRYALERKRTSDQLARYADELRARNVQMESDFNMARDLQQVFLPQHYPTFPRSASSEESALQFHHRYIPAAAVGGDFFNVFPLTNTRAGVFICDVMGHGMRAALVTAILRGLVEQLIPANPDAGKAAGGGQPQSPRDPEAHRSPDDVHCLLSGGGCRNAGRFNSQAQGIRAVSD